MRRFFRIDRRKDRDKTEDRPREAPRAESSTAPATVPQQSASTSKQPALPPAAVTPSPGPGYPTGINLLYDPAEGKAIVDIVFIHGLKGHREKTWTSEKTSEPWPKSLLPSEIPNARVLAYGYDADVAKATEVVSASRIRDHAATLLKRLINFRDRTNSSTRSIIFVCHSLGGLVCQAAISRAHTREHLKEVFDCTRGILFLGTPHHGSALAVWAERLAKSVGVLKQTNTEILGVLRPESEVLAEIQDNFHNITQSQTKAGVGAIQITCFYEELPLPGIGLVVPQHSAIFPGKDAIGIHGTHHTMVKFGSPDDSGFIDICDELRSWIKKLDREASRLKEQIKQPDVVEEQTERTLTAPKERTAAKFLVPYARNKSFVGRDDVFERLKSEFCHGPQDDIEDAKSRVCLYGLGGNGKTQIAIEYTYWLRRTNPEISIFWVHASSTERFRKAFSEIARQCYISGSSAPNTDVLERVKSWFQRQTTAPWFLVLDNCDDTYLFFNDHHQPDDAESPEVGSGTGTGNLARFIPDYGNGSILVTTRNKQAGSRLVPGQAPLEVESMNDDESVRMIREISGDSMLSAEAASVLSNRLSNLPLAIAQAAAFIQENCISIRQYLDILDKGNNAEIQLLSENFEAVGRPDGIPRAVMATWVVSFEHIKKTNSLAAEMLSLMAFFDRHAIHRQFLTIYMYLESISREKKCDNETNDSEPSSAQHEVRNDEENRSPTEDLRDSNNPEDYLILGDYNCSDDNISECTEDTYESFKTFEQDGANSIRLEQALGILKAFSFIKESKNETLEMHRLVQLATLAWLTRKGLANASAGKALSTMAELFSIFRRHSTMSFQPIPHCQAIIAANSGNTVMNNSLTIWINHNMAELYLMMAQPMLALNTIESNLAAQEHNQQSEYYFGATRLKARILQTLGRKQEAKQTLVVLSSIQPHDSASMFCTIELRAALCEESGDYMEIKDLLLSAIAKLAENDDDDLIPKACLMAQLSMTYSNLDDTKEAEETYLQLLGLLKEASESRPSNLELIKAAMSVFTAQGRWQEAETIFHLATHDKAFDNSESAVKFLGISCILTYVMSAQDRFQEAFENQRQGMHYIKQLREAGIVVRADIEAVLMIQSGSLLLQQGLLEDADKCMTNALQLLQNTGGDFGTLSLMCTFLYAWIKYEQEPREETMEMMENVYQHSLRELGPEHVMTDTCMVVIEDLAACKLSSGNEALGKEEEEEEEEEANRYGIENTLVRLYKPLDWGMLLREDVRGRTSIK